MEFLSVSSSNKWDRHRIRVKELLNQGESAVDTEVTVKGWIRTTRMADKNKFMFIELTDGSSVRGIQIIVDMENTPGANETNNCGGVGASISVTGRVSRSTGKGQVIEISATKIDVIGCVYGGDNGTVGAKNYPMAKKAHSLEFLREMAHLRIRSKMFSSAMRVRHAMAFATHKFFNERGFVYTHTPLITGADCEGAGEQFTVTTLFPNEHAKISDVPVTPTGMIDFSKDFFGRRCHLTVSGQLNVETHACALSDVYTFGPTFRAENSHTSRHLAEFWMIEPEICFANLRDDMALAEDYVKFCTKYALVHCADDLKYFDEEYPAGEKGLRARLQNVVDNDFAHITYTEAVNLLHENINSGRCIHKIVTKIQKTNKGKIEIKEKITYNQKINGEWVPYTPPEIIESSTSSSTTPTTTEGTNVNVTTTHEETKTYFERIPEWGEDLGSEHERFICEKIFGRPTIVTDYPKQIKAFYMKLNPDEKTVAAMDILVPKIGELIGGSQREEKLEVLEARCKEMNIKLEDMWWYADMRRYGTIPHAGFGLGFERLIMFVTGLENIRDVIPFPRVPGHAEF